MKHKEFLLTLSVVAGLSLGTVSGVAQQAQTVAATSATTSAGAVVPQLVNYSGTLTDANGKPLTGIVGVTFFLYKDADGGAPLWMETQNVAVTSGGHYSVMLGSTTSTGLPQDVFVSGEARWLGVQPEGQTEQPRVLLVAVPYALKAGDAETIGGLPASAFLRADSANNTETATIKSATTSTTAGNAKAANAPPSASTVTTSGGTVNAVPLWTTSTNIQSSALSQTGSGATAKIGVGTTTPAATLDVAGKGDIRDTLTLFPKASDNTLAINGTTFKIDSTGKLTFISGQTFPGAGTITGITTASGSGLSGGGTSGTLSLQVPSAGITNTMLANSKITLNANTAGGLTTPGAMALGSTYTIGLKPCSANQVLQYSGSVWNCAGVGTGTITGITTASGSGLTGGGTSGTLNLAVNPGIVAELAAANSFTNNNSIGVNSANPALKVANANGDGIDVSAGSGSYGVYANGAEIGVYGVAQYGGWFEGTTVGLEGFSDTDNDLTSGTYAFEFGSTQETLGLWSYSASPAGVAAYAQVVERSAEGQIFNGARPISVWGDSDSSGAVGVLGTVDNGYAAVFYNNSTSATGWFENDENSSTTDLVFHTAGGHSGGACSIDVSGNLGCSGSITPVVPVSGGSRKVALNTIGSPEHWFEDAGSGQLSNGQAVINIESVFGETVNTATDYHVFLTPKGDCKGLYVAQESATSFVVRELGGGTSSIAFDYRIMAKRKGFEQARLEDVTQQMNQPNPRPAGTARRIMPKPADIRKAQLAHLHARLTQPALKTK